MPVEKVAGSPVYAVSINQFGAIEIRAERPRHELWQDHRSGRTCRAVTVRLLKQRVRAGWIGFRRQNMHGADKRGEEMIRAEHVILANGSNPTALPGLEFGGPVISSTEA
jgi:pyruvate/2-oxoglutarate dehydrogenase complex dihydrolipoamide dehydrogenase (E3) component